MILRHFLQKIQLTRQCSTHSSSLNTLFASGDPSKIAVKHQGSIISIKGWVKSVRKMKENIFFDVSDGSSDKVLQIVIPQSIKPENLTTGSSVVVNGSIGTTPKGHLELKATEVTMCHSCCVSEGYPFVPRQQYTPEMIREHLHLRTRTNFFTSMLRIRHCATMGMHNYFSSEGFINVATPILTSNDCEGAGEVFTVVPENKDTLKAMSKPNTPVEQVYFDTKAYLTVSGQLHLEAAAHGLNKVYTFGPVFRAENSRSRLHLSEFYMVEAEIAFLEQIEPLINVIENLVKYTTRHVLDKCEGDLLRLRPKENKDIAWLDKSFSVLTFDEAIDIVKRNSVGILERDGLTKEQELFLVKHNGNVPVFVINWPKNIKPFYMKECTDCEEKVAALDLLVPNVGELVGGSLREDNYEKLKSKLPSNSLDLDWYLDLRKFGSVSTGGFGLGFERYLQLITDTGNIKDTIPFPRWPHNCCL